MYKGNVHFNNDFAEMIHKELFNLIWYRNKRKVDHPSDTKHGGSKDIMDGVVGSLYNAYTQKDVIIRPDDILNLASFNSEEPIDLSSFEDSPDEIFEGIKRVSIDKLDDISMYINN